MLFGVEEIRFVLQNYIVELDYNVFHFINQNMQNNFFDAVIPVLRNKYTWIPIYIFIFIVLIKKYKFNAIYLILFLICCFGITDFCNYQIFKPLFQRERPCYNTLLEVRLLLDSCGGKWSFPSSHAANHAALSVGLLFIQISKNTILNCIIIFWAIIVGFAQIYVGVHYPSDIIVGFLVGISIAFLIFKIFKSKLRKL